MFFGAEVKGARRWIILAGVNIQPSEFVKPAFVILIALAVRRVGAAAGNAGQHHRARPADAGGDVAGAAAGLSARPCWSLLVWGALFFLAGMRLIWVFGLGRRWRLSASRVRYHRRSPRRRTHQAIHGPRIGRHLSGADVAWSRFLRGGWFGRGPGEGTVEARAAGQPCRLRFRQWRPRNSASCSALCCVALFAFIVIRALRQARSQNDSFTRFAVSGLAILFGTAIGHQHGGESCI